MTKEDIKQICQIYDNFRSERDVATIAYNSDDTFWEHILATYNLSKPSLPSALEKAARYVYESWMGGTMDDVRRDMVELGKVLNARKK